MARRGSSPRRPRDPRNRCRGAGAAAPARACSRCGSPARSRRRSPCARPAMRCAACLVGDVGCGSRCASKPRPRRVATTSSSGPASRATSTTFAPRSPPVAPASARPRPRLAPVTMAPRPRFFMTSSVSTAGQYVVNDPLFCCPEAIRLSFSIDSPRREQVTAIREARGLSQAQIAKAAGIPREDAGRTSSRAPRIPRSRQRIKVANALQVRLDELLAAPRLPARHLRAAELPVRLARHGHGAQAACPSRCPASISIGWICRPARGWLMPRRPRTRRARGSTSPASAARSSSWSPASATCSRRATWSRSAAISGTAITIRAARGGGRVLGDRVRAGDELASLAMKLAGVLTVAPAFARAAAAADPRSRRAARVSRRPAGNRAAARVGRRALPASSGYGGKSELFAGHDARGR